MKHKIWIIAVLIGCFSLFGYTSYAYFVTEKTAVNVITSGEVKIKLLEWADKEKTVPFSNKESVHVMPGAKVTKVVEVKNTGTDDTWIRIALQQDKVLLNINTTDWIEQNGFYYYKKPLKAGKTTEPLFTEVSFPKDTGNEYQEQKVSVDVKVYAVQVSNNGKNVLEAKGWPLAE